MFPHKNAILCKECSAVPLGQLVVWFTVLCSSCGLPVPHADATLLLGMMCCASGPDVSVVLCALQVQVCLCINHNYRREISQMHLHQQVGQHGADLFRVAGGCMFNSQHTCSRRGSGGMFNCWVTCSWRGSGACPMPAKNSMCSSAYALYCIYPSIPFNATLMLGMFCLRARFVSICISSLFSIHSALHSDATLVMGSSKCFSHHDATLM